MDRKAAVVSRGVEPTATFVVACGVRRDCSLADRALLRVESLQPRERRLGHPICRLTTGSYVVAERAQIDHGKESNAGSESAARHPLRTAAAPSSRTTSTSRSRSAAVVRQLLIAGRSAALPP